MTGNAAIQAAERAKELLSPSSVGKSWRFRPTGCSLRIVAFSTRRIRRKA